MLRFFVGEISCTSTPKNRHMLELPDLAFDILPCQLWPECQMIGRGFFETSLN